MSTPVTRWLDRAPSAVLVSWAAVASFGAYACMYGFRKTFAAATFDGDVMLPFAGALDLKILYILAQVVGYATSKFLGIKVVSELVPGRRALALVACIGVAELALVAFGLLPPGWAALAMVANGLPLGMVWGLVFGFLEGRRSSDGLGAFLCASFIVASGFAKDVGKELLGRGVSEGWMPATAGLLFLPPLLVFAWMLAQLPPPSAADEAVRSKRAPMDGAARAAFWDAWAPGLVAIVSGYVLLTAYRDFRDNFAREIWDALGFADTPGVMTNSELPIALGSLAAVGAVMAVRDNRAALAILHAIMVGGAVLIGAATFAWQAGWIAPEVWMISVGLGLYLGYVPANCVLFDRLVAAAGSVATAGFLIYVADAYGYLGSCALLFWKNFGSPELSWLSFFATFSYVAAVGTAATYAWAGVWMWRRTAGVAAPASPAVE